MQLSYVKLIFINSLMLELNTLAKDVTKRRLGLVNAVYCVRTDADALNIYQFTN